MEDDLNHVWALAAKRVLSRVDALLEAWQEPPSASATVLTQFGIRMVELRAAMDVFAEIDGQMEVEIDD